MNIEMLKQQTMQLKHTLRQIDSQYEHVRMTKKQADFEKDIKPFVDEIHHLVNEWENHSKIWIKQKRPKNLHNQQIELAAENVKTISVQSFFAETSYKRFKQSVHSIQYIVEKMLMELKTDVNE
ncbi:YppE family protein [Bacillus kwashiorkori]|uniref:YppE family protein n=1 Tax=Bacillus kwashiorkori TaxID=1522318 RepID=UPI0007832773|nr:YppE family protein [Bacillus kwashiorkori]